MTIGYFYNFPPFDLCLKYKILVKLSCFSAPFVRKMFLRLTTAFYGYDQQIVCIINIDYSYEQVVDHSYMNNDHSYMHDFSPVHSYEKIDHAWNLLIMLWRAIDHIWKLLIIAMNRHWSCMITYIFMSSWTFWSSGNLVIWSIWLSGHLVIWSICHLVIWSSGRFQYCERLYYSFETLE